MCADLIAGACRGRRPQHNKAIERLDAVPTLLQMAREGSKGEVRAACEALASVCHGSASNSASVVQRRGVSILVAAIQSGGPDVKGAAAEAVANVFRSGTSFMSVAARQ